MYTYGIVGNARVLDGDTFDATIDLGFSIRYEARIRMNGIDAPEVHTLDAREKAFGLRAKSWLESALSRGELIVTTELDRGEKYGRVLGTVWVKGETASLNEQLIAARLVWPYNGGTKIKALDALAP